MRCSTLTHHTSLYFRSVRAHHGHGNARSTSRRSDRNTVVHTTPSGTSASAVTAASITLTTSGNSNSAQSNALLASPSSEVSFRGVESSTRRTSQENNEVLKNQIGDLESVITGLRVHVDALTQAILSRDKDLSSERAMSANALAEKQASVVSLESRVRELLNQVRALESSVELKDAENARCQQGWDASIQQLSKSEICVADLSRDLQLRDKLIEEYAQKIITLEEELAAKALQCDVYRDMLSDRDIHIDRMSMQAEDSQGLIRALQTSLAERTVEVKQLVREAEERSLLVVSLQTSLADRDIQLQAITYEAIGGKEKSNRRISRNVSMEMLAEGDEQTLSGTWRTPMKLPSISGPHHSTATTTTNTHTQASPRSTAEHKSPPSTPYTPTLSLLSNKHRVPALLPTPAPPPVPPAPKPPLVVGEYDMEVHTHIQSIYPPIWP